MDQYINLLFNNAHRATTQLAESLSGEMADRAGSAARQLDLLHHEWVDEQEGKENTPPGVA